MIVEKSHNLIKIPCPSCTMASEFGSILPITQTFEIYFNFLFYFETKPSQKQYSKNNKQTEKIWNVVLKIFNKNGAIYS